MRGLVLNPHAGAEMTWEEIARRLGVSKSAVQQYYANGMAKLRNRPRTLARLRELAAMRQREVDARGVTLPETMEEERG